MLELLPVVDAPSGLNALIVLDDTTLGPAVGGVRTHAYASPAALEEDAKRLARAMTIKCALAELDAGGGKIVVEASALIDRPAAFAALGAAVDRLGGRFLTSGDYGTTADDLAAMARVTDRVQPDAAGLADAVARGLLGCAQAAARALGHGDLKARTALVMGAGTVGAAVVRALVRAGATVSVCDVDGARAEKVARETGARVIAPADALTTQTDLFVPCAIGGVIDDAVAASLPARAVVGAANNVLATPSAGLKLAARRVVEVPDSIASAGGVIAGVSRRLMDAEPGPLIDALGATAAAVLEEARATGRPPGQVAIERAEGRIRGGR